MAPTDEVIKDIVIRLLPYPFFFGLAEAYVELLPSDDEVAAAIARVCENEGGSPQWGPQADWIVDSMWVWFEALATSGVAQADANLRAQQPARAFAQEWVALVKATCDDLTAGECEALDALAAGIVNFTWIGFDKDEPFDNMIVLHFHVAEEVYVLWAREEFRDPAGFVMD